jgi:hypothetical protein
MCPTNLRNGCCLLCAMLLLACGTPALRAEESARGRELRHLLDQSVRFSGWDDPRTTLNEGLEALSKHFNLSFDINEHAFKQAHIEEVGKFEVVSPKPIPAMHTRLGTVLKKVLSRVSPSATYIIRDDLIEITTVQAVRKEFFADRPDGPFPPLVAGTFEKVPLEAALKELAHAGNVVLDSRAAKEGQTAVTADLVNVPLDTAVRMLADMAGLKVVPLDNVFYVTSKDNATLLLEEQEKLRLKRQREKKEKTSKPKTENQTPSRQTSPEKKEKT